MLDRATKLRDMVSARESASPGRHRSGRGRRCGRDLKWLSASTLLSIVKHWTCARVLEPDLPDFTGHLTRTALFSVIRKAEPIAGESSFFRIRTSIILMHRLAYNSDVVALKMGRRRGARRAHI